MNALIILFTIMFVVGLVLAANYLAVSRQERNQPPRQPAPIDWDAIDDEMVQTEMAKGNKIGAIKRYRQLTNLGLKEAKDAIDYAMLHPDERGDKKKKAAYDAQDAGIRDLIADGQMNEAIEIYQKFAGVDLYTARDAVEAIANDLRLSDNSISDTAYEPPSDRLNRQ
jgi:ribosomal protein L7/L12